MGFNPGGGGAIATATDVAFSSLQDNQVLTYDNSSSKWANEIVQGGDITQFSATVVYGSNAVPARPSGYARVVWVGVADPASNAQQYDAWEQTA